jgi:hypothetical protein
MHWVKEPQDSRFSGLDLLSDGAIDYRDGLEHHDDKSTERKDKNNQQLPIRSRSLSETAFDMSSLSAWEYPQDYGTGRNPSPLGGRSSLPTTN